MKIKLAILEKDSSYLNRLASTFGSKYTDKLQIYSFTNLDNAMSAIVSERIDVFLAGDSFDIEIDKIPDRCAFAYFVESSDVDMLNEQRAICKFQKADLIYRQVLSIYSENAGNIGGLKMDNDDCRIIYFSSVSGGTGTTTMAAACAMNLASKGKKAIYLNLEVFGSSDILFSAEGQFDMSDIIFSLKTKKANVSMKLESCVKQDNSGVYYFSQSKTALDMLELNDDDILRLINELKLSGSYDYIILDHTFGFDSLNMKLMKQSNSIVFVGDGSESSNIKIYRAYNALKILEQNDDSITFIGNISLIYNKFSNKTSKALDGVDLKVINGAPRYEHATLQQVLKQLSALSAFDKIAE